MRLILTLATALLIAAPALSRPLDKIEGERLDQAVTSFGAALTGRDSAALIGSIPPRLIDAIAVQSGMDSTTLKATLVTQSDAMLAGTTFSDLKTDIAAVDASDARMPDGSTSTWALVPISFVMDQNGARTAYRQTILALYDGGAWYLMRIEDPMQRDLAATVYPFLADVTIPPTEKTPLK